MAIEVKSTFKPRPPVQGDPFWKSDESTGWRHPGVRADESCAECNGEGKLYTPVPGGRYNRSIGTWEPDERATECPVCEGAGAVSVVRCARCGRLHGNEPVEYSDVEYCDCDEDDLIAWQSDLRTMWSRIGMVGATASSLRDLHGLEVTSVVLGVGWNDLHALAALDKQPVTYSAGRDPVAGARVGGVEVVASEKP